MKKRNLLYVCLSLFLIVSWSGCEVQTESIQKTTQIQPDNRPFPLVENFAKNGPEFSGDWYGNVLGVIRWGDKWRVYYQNRAEERAEFTESDDLVSWSRPEPVSMPMEMFLFTKDGTVLCYQAEGDNLYLWNDFSPDRGCTNKQNLMYTWNIDGQVNLAYTDEEWISLGRVRGLASQNQGGWGDDDTEYPVEEDFPEIEQAFKDYPKYDAKDFIQDRRGISIHTSRDGITWESKILADPEEMDTNGFQGWKEKNSNGLADFYSAVPLDSNRVLVKVFWKEKSRLVDRTEYDGRMTDPRLRYRFTGETTIIPAVIKNGQLQITSTESVIPREFHTRNAPSDVYWATAPDKMEVGQMTPANRVVENEGYVYVFYQYRDDIHYENPYEVTGERVLSGIYMYRIKKEEFDQLFR